MEFKNIRLGPALKIIGYSSYLRAKSRILNMNRQNKPAIEIKTETPSSQPSHPTFQGEEQFSRSQTESVTPVVDSKTPPRETSVSSSQSSVTSTSKGLSMIPALDERTISTVAFQNFPGQHNIDEAIPLHNEVPSISKTSGLDSTKTNDDDK